MWNNVSVLEDHICDTSRQVGTPLENSGTPWGVRYTRLTSTEIRLVVSRLGECLWLPTLHQMKKCFEQAAANLATRQLATSKIFCNQTSV